MLWSVLYVILRRGKQKIYQQCSNILFDGFGFAKYGMKNAKTIPQILRPRMHLAIQVLLTLTCSKTHLKFFFVSQNKFWMMKKN